MVRMLGLSYDYLRIHSDRIYDGIVRVRHKPKISFVLYSLLGESRTEKQLHHVRTTVVCSTRDHYFMHSVRPSPVSQEEFF